MSAVVAAFPNVSAAIEAVVAVRGSGLEPAALEFLDAHHAQMLDREEGVDLAALPTLFMEFHAAHQGALDAGIKLVRDLCAELGATDVRATSDAAERRRLWHARHHALEINQRNNPGMRWVILDVAVPISNYPALVAGAQEVLEASGAVGYLIGHAGDGNLHLAMPVAGNAGYERALDVNEAIVLRALALEGTATGEHGVGIGKARYMEREHGPALSLMRTLKATLDPRGILNPGKLFP